MPPDERTERFTVSLPHGLLRELDAQVGEGGHASRSELIRDLIRERIVERSWREEREEVFGVLTIAYDHHQRGLVQKIIDLQHSRLVHVLCSTHVHLDHDSCLEAILLKGRAEEIERIAAGIGGLRGVRLARLTRASRIPG